MSLAPTTQIIYNIINTSPYLLKKVTVMLLAKGNTYTTKDIYELPDGKQQRFL